MPFQKGHKLAKGGARPGSGPKTSAIRELCAKAFKERIPILCEIADSASEAAKDRIAAIKELGRVGVAEQKEIVGKDGEKLVVKVVRGVSMDDL